MVIAAVAPIKDFLLVEAPVTTADPVERGIVLPRSAEVGAMLDGRRTEVVVIVGVSVTALITILAVSRDMREGRPGMGSLAVVNAEASHEEVGVAAIGAVMEAVEALIEGMAGERAGTVNELSRYHRVDLFLSGTVPCWRLFEGCNLLFFFTVSLYYNLQLRCWRDVVNRERLET